MWSFLFISNHLQASGWELASLEVPPFFVLAVLIGFAVIVLFWLMTAF